jgi:hypothetical protein
MQRTGLPCSSPTLGIESKVSAPVNPRKFPTPIWANRQEAEELPVMMFAAHQIDLSDQVCQAGVLEKGEHERITVGACGPVLDI